MDAAPAFTPGGGSLFGVVMAVNTLLFIALQSYILRKLIKPELMSRQVPHLTRKSLVGVLSYLLGVAATWFNSRAAFVPCALTPPFLSRRHKLDFHWCDKTPESCEVLADGVVAGCPLAKAFGVSAAFQVSADDTSTPTLILCVRTCASVLSEVIICDST
jgi:hypothetical protein